MILGQGKGSPSNASRVRGGPFSTVEDRKKQQYPFGFFLSLSHVF
jgi:hypothetical protein